MNSNKQAFLPHVAGMRAFAILLVVWFHFTQHNSDITECVRLPQGFYGVDVFIVIMGYFLFVGFERKPDISWRLFFSSKLVRLLFPLSVSVLITCLSALFSQDFIGLRELATTAIAAMTGWANIQLEYASSGYFNSDSSMNPFLHTWYIGVTIQLFIVAYILFICLKNRGLKTKLIVLILVGGMSFVCDMLDPIRTVFHLFGVSCPWSLGIFSYYDTIPRVWELLAGGIVFLLPQCSNKKISTFVSGFSFLCIMIPSCSASTSSTVSILVVLGTILLIKYGGNNYLSTLLENKTAQFLGNISFALYLVHVPVIVFYKGFYFISPYLLQVIILLIISIIIAWGFHMLIEKRNFSHRTKAVTFGFSILFCIFTWSTNGLKNIWNAESNNIANIRYSRPTLCTWPNITKGLNRHIMELHHEWYTCGWYEELSSTEKCPPSYPLFHIGPKDKQPTFALIGDSHAEHFYAGFDVIGKELGISGVFLASIIEPFWNRECPRVVKNYFYNREKAEALMNWLNSHPEIKTIIISQSWKKLLYRNQDWDKNPVEPSIKGNLPTLREFCSKLRSMGKHIVIIAPTPQFENKKVSRCARWQNRRKIPMDLIPDTFICTTDEYKKDNDEINAYLNEMERLGECDVLRPHEYLFASEKCYAFEPKRLIFVDESHISVQTSLFLSKKMAKQLHTIFTKNDE